MKKSVTNKARNNYLVSELNDHATKTFLERLVYSLIN